MPFLRLARSLLPAVALALSAAAAPAETAVTLPPPATDVAASGNEQVAVIAGGCFWGIQLIYQHTEGVIQAVSGYAGGSKADATYDRVSTGRTGHAESVQIRFDPRRSPMARSCRSSSRSRTIRPNSTGRARTKDRSIARRSSMPIPSRSAWPRPTSSSSAS